MRIFLTVGLLGFIVIAQMNPIGSFQYWMCMFAVLILTGFAYGGLFSLFLVTGLLSLGYTDMQSDSGFNAVFLPFYTGFSIMGLLVMLVLMYPKLLGRQIKSSQLGGFWIGGL